MSQCVAVLGAGHSGLAMSVHLALNGTPVHLWNRTESNISKLIETHEIFCDGVVKGTGHINIVSSNMKEIVNDAKIVFVTTPASAHKDIAKSIAPFIKEDMIIVLNPGRTFGAIDFIKTLKQHGCKYIPQVAESQTIVYTCRKKEDNKVDILALKNNVFLSSIRNADSYKIIEQFPPCLQKHFTIADSMVQTSLGNVGMILHCTPVLFNIGWIENEKTRFKYYYDGITKSIAAFLEKLDQERILVGRKLGTELESTSNWMRRSYGIEGADLYECIRNNDAYRTIDAPKSITHRYITEDIPCGLVPLENIAHLLDINTPNISTIIDLSIGITGTDFRKIGRTIGQEDISLLREEI